MDLCKFGKIFSLSQIGQYFWRLFYKKSISIKLSIVISNQSPKWSSDDLPYPNTIPHPIKCSNLLSLLNSNPNPFHTAKFGAKSFPQPYPIKYSDLFPFCKSNSNPLHHPKCGTHWFTELYPIKYPWHPLMKYTLSKSKCLKYVNVLVIRQRIEFFPQLFSLTKIT